MAEILNGSVVYSTIDGSRTPLLITGKSGTNLEGITPAGAEIRISMKRVEFTSRIKPGAIRSAGDLKELFQRTGEIMEKITQAEAWELLVEEGTEPVTLETVTELLLGETEGGALDAVYLTLLDDPTFFKAGPGGTYKVQPRRVVEERLEQLARTQERENALKAASEELAGAVKAGAGTSELSQAARQELETVRQAALGSEVSPRTKRVLEIIYPSSSRPYQELAFRVFVDLGVWEEHQDLNLFKLGLPRDWSPECLAEVASVLAAFDPEPNEFRRDLSHLLTLAIDDPETTEVDDALALERDGDSWILHVMIADVASLIPAGSELDREARSRASTVYHPRGFYSMLPEEIATGPASLNQGRRRSVVDIQLHLSPAGVVVDTRLELASIKVDRQMSYELVDRIIAGDPEVSEPEEVKELVSTLGELTTRLQANRISQGAVMFMRPEFKVRVSRDLVVKVKRVDPDSPGRRLVAEAMIASCAGTGRYLAELGVPGVFRVQNPPDESLEWTMERGKDPVWLYQNLRRLKKGEISGQPGRHSSLGVEAYCQVTSPIRRYGDLVMQRQMISMLRRNTPAYGQGEILEVLAAVDSTASQVSRTQMDAERYWKLVALAQVSEPLTAVVLDNHSGGTVVDLLDFGLRTKLHASRKYSPGDRIEVKLVKAEARTDLLVVRD